MTNNKSTKAKIITGWGGLSRLKGSVRKRIKRDASKRRRKFREPRYDDVFYEGLAQLDKAARE